MKLEMPKTCEIWRHHKGGLVMIGGVGWDAEREVPVVTYFHINSSGKVHNPDEFYVHTINDWFKLTDNRLNGPTPRFRKEVSK